MEQSAIARAQRQSSPTKRTKWVPRPALDDGRNGEHDVDVVDEVQDSNGEEEVSEEKYFVDTNVKSRT